jgi:hypothetical protein
MEYPQTRVPAPSVLGPCAGAATHVLSPFLSKRRGERERERVGKEGSLRE